MLIVGYVNLFVILIAMINVNEIGYLHTLNDTSEMRVISFYSYNLLSFLDNHFLSFSSEHQLLYSLKADLLRRFTARDSNHPGLLPTFRCI